MKMMEKERKEAYVEVLEILKNMDKTQVSKVPLELREFFERNASKEYEFHIDKNSSLKEYKLKESTINILAMLNVNYWCEKEEHKKELLKKYHENDLIREKELREKYSTDNLFKRDNKNSYVQERNEIFIMPIAYEKDKWYKQIYINILKFIKQIFNKNR